MGDRDRDHIVELEAAPSPAPGARGRREAAAPASSLPSLPLGVTNLAQRLWRHISGLGKDHNDKDDANTASPKDAGGTLAADKPKPRKPATGRPKPRKPPATDKAKVDRENRFDDRDSRYKRGVEPRKSTRTRPRRARAAATRHPKYAARNSAERSHPVSTRAGPRALSPPATPVLDPRAPSLYAYNAKGSALPLSVNYAREDVWVPPFMPPDQVGEPHMDTHLRPSASASRIDTVSQAEKQSTPAQPFVESDDGGRDRPPRASFPDAGGHTSPPKLRASCSSFRLSKEPPLSGSSVSLSKSPTDFVSPLPAQPPLPTPIVVPPRPHDDRSAFDFGGAHYSPSFIARDRSATPPSGSPQATAAAAASVAVPAMSKSSRAPAAAVSMAVPAMSKSSQKAAAASVAAQPLPTPLVVRPHDDRSAFDFGGSHYSPSFITRDRFATPPSGSPKATAAAASVAATPTRRSSQPAAAASFAPPPPSKSSRAAVAASAAASRRDDRPWVRHE